MTAATTMVANRKSKTSGPTRGGIAKRRNVVRADRDGDLVMDSSTRGRGGIAKATRGAPAEKSARTPRLSLIHI